MRRVGIATLLACLTASARLAAQPAALTYADPRAGSSVLMAYRRAHVKLTEPACRQIYSDFEVSGLGLDAVLASSGRSGAEHFRNIRFADGDARPACRRGGVLAFTSPGGPVVYLCTRSFAEAARENIEVAAATLIHEQLHSLGLSENPPTAAEITQRVLQRCGR